MLILNSAYTQNPFENGKRLMSQKKYDLASEQFNISLKKQPNKAYDISYLYLSEATKLIKTGNKNDANKLYYAAVSLSQTYNLTINTYYFKEFFKAINIDSVFTMIGNLVPYFNYNQLTDLMLELRQNDTVVTEAYLSHSRDGYCHVLWLYPTNSSTENYQKLFGSNTFNPIASYLLSKISLYDIYSISPKAFVLGVKEDRMYLTENMSNGFNYSSITELNDKFSQLREKNDLQIAAEKENVINEIIKFRNNYLLSNLKYLSSTFKISGRYFTGINYYDIDRQVLSINVFFDCAFNYDSILYVATVEAKLSLNEAQKFFESENEYSDKIEIKVKNGKERKKLGLMYDSGGWWVPNLYILDELELEIKNLKGDALAFKTSGLKGKLYADNLNTDKYSSGGHHVRIVNGINVQQLKMMEDAKVKETKDFEKYLAENKIKVNPTESGLYFIEITKGIGIKAVKGRKVKVNYTGKLIDGKIFDTSIKADAMKGNVYNEKRPYQPIEFTLGRGDVIPGWDEAISMMKVGGKAKLVIPSKLGYGEKGVGSTIPPCSILIFEVELVSVEN